MKKRTRQFVWLVIMMCCTLVPLCYAEPTPTDKIIQNQLELLDWDSIREVEAHVKEGMPQSSDFDLAEEVKNLVTGETRFSLEYILRTIGELFLQESATYISLIVRFILIVIMCSLLQTLTTSFKSQQTTKAAFLVCYMLIIFIVSQSLFVIVDLAQATVSYMSEMMMATLPTLLAFMAVSGYITSSSAMATIVIAVLNVMTFVVRYVILPVVVTLIILQIVGSMSEEIKVDKFVKLFYKVAGNGLKLIFAISIGIMGIYKLTLPYIDVAIKKSAFSISSSFLPVVGDASKGALEFVLSCAQLIKNSFAIGVILWIVIVASVPLIKMVAYTFLYHLAGAIIQPVGDKKMSEIASILGKGCEFILSCTGTVVLLTIVVMIVCCSIGTSLT